MPLRILKIVTIGFFIIIICPIILSNCKKKDLTEGEKLAKTYCTSCHMFPEPSLLPKNVWKLSTLPYMGIMMGVASEVKNLPEPLKAYEVLKPENQMVSDADWHKIKEYFIESSIEKLEVQPKLELNNISQIFDIEPIDTKTKKLTIPNFTYVGIDSLNKRIFAGDQSNRQFWIFDSKGSVLENVQNQDAITHIDLGNAKNEDYFITFMGKTTQANLEAGGRITNFGMANGNQFNIKQTIATNLNRPVASIIENLDEEPGNEILICEFGFRTAGLSIWKKDKKNTFQKKYLSETTGAIKSIITDYNKDGKKDIVTLFADGKERIVVYLNKGKLQFEEKTLLTFPPIYGSSSFEIADLNKDGKDDIVYTAGDNADFTTILKPYHGVYIFENQGNFNYKQTQFFRQNGAYKCLTRDFDMDGDLDIASISLFPDVENRPLEGFLILENNHMKFDIKTLPINHLGRWSVMDAGDLDADGDIDIVLGSHPVAKFPAGFDQAWKQGSGLVVLRNKTIMN